MNEKIKLIFVPFLTMVFVGYNLIVGLTGGIDNAAHIGGLVSGFVVGLLLSPQLKNQIDAHKAEGEMTTEDL